MEKCVFRQGCTYDPPIKITIDGKVPTEKDVSKIHFRFRNIIKSFPDSKDVKCESGKFIVHLSSQDTLNLPACCDNEIEIIIVFPRGETKPVKPVNGITTFDVEATGFPEEVFRDE